MLQASSETSVVGHSTVRQLMGTLAWKRRRPENQTHWNVGGSAVREMGQSAWLTSFIHHTEYGGKSQRDGTRN